MKMVGLSVVLESSHTGSSCNNGVVFSPKPPQVINKTAVSKTASHRKNGFPEPCFPSNTFLEHCFLCKQRLLPGKDIYMYKGDRAFCSVECRSRQIFMDEEESLEKENCSSAVVKPTPSPSTSRPPGGGQRNRAGGFAY